MLQTLLFKVGAESIVSPTQLSGSFAVAILKALYVIGVGGEHFSSSPKLFSLLGFVFSLCPWVKRAAIAL